MYCTCKILNCKILVFPKYRLHNEVKYLGKTRRYYQAVTIYGSGSGRISPVTVECKCVHVCLFNI